MSWKGWILLDEISMVSVPLLAVLDQLRLNGTKICSFGDWAQLEPHPESNSGEVQWSNQMPSRKVECINYGVSVLCLNLKDADDLIKNTLIFI